MASFWGEMKRRNVFKVGTVYIIVAWLVIQVADTTFASFGIPDWVMRATVLLLILGLPLILIFAWAFEITPHGLKRTEDVRRENSITHITGRKFDFAFIALLLIAVSYFAIDKFVLPHVDFTTAERTAEVDFELPQDGLLRIVVLPFTNMSADRENEYFSDGVSEELLNVLSTVEGLKVTSRTTAFAYKDTELAIPDIARELKVSHVLEGSVRKSGNRVRITAQLIDVGSDAHLWSDTFDRTLDDIFEVQEDISRSIVKELMLVLGREEVAASFDIEAPTQNTEAYELFLQGQYLFRQRGGENLLEAIRVLENAVGIDPQFARAWGVLGGTWAVLAGYTREVSGAEANSRATAAIERALTLDPQLAGAHATNGLLVSRPGDWAESLAHFDRAIELDPDDVMSHFWQGLTYARVGYQDKALEKYAEAIEIEPTLGIVYSWRGRAYLSKGEIEKAEENYRRAINLNFHQESNTGLAHIAMMRNDPETALEHWHRYQDSLSVERSSATDLALRARADSSLREQAIQELELLDVAYLSGDVWWLMADMGELDSAITRLADQLTPPTNSLAPSLMWYAWRADLRAHPRFLETLGLLKLVDFWETHGYPPGCDPMNGGLVCE